jgi:hypothetical protein
VRPLGVVVVPPALDDDPYDDPGLGKRVEDLSIEQFAAKPGVEAVDEAVLPGTARSTYAILARRLRSSPAGPWR